MGHWTLILWIHIYSSGHVPFYMGQYATEQSCFSVGQKITEQEKAEDSGTHFICISDIDVTAKIKAKP